jgi:hypothetical protein
MVQAGIDEADEPRWAAAEAWLSSDKAELLARDHTGGTVLTAAASYSPLVIAEGPLIHRYGELGARLT